MKRGIVILTIGLLAGLAAYGCVFFVCMADARKLAQSERPELAWLKQEFQLNDAEFQRVSDLHLAYLPQCAEMCAKVAITNEKLRELLSQEMDVTPEIEQALHEVSKLRAECQAKMLKHFFEVSRTMPPDQGKRYLGWVQQKAFASDRDMATAHHPSTHGQSPEESHSNH